MRLLFNRLNNMSEKTNEILIPDEIIMNKIYYIRGQKVMLDSELAELYGVETRRLNEQVARNADRFPEDFMFRLNENEFESLMSQIATSKRGGRRKLPYMFSEHGVLMLSSVLNSKQAIQVNIQVMRIFTRIRQMLMDNTEYAWRSKRSKPNWIARVKIWSLYFDIWMN